jgi:hypothetical protein
MLYKKGDPADPTNYRPIGLARTVYKLWTSLVTRVLSDYAERNSIIGDSQEGFRGGRNTHRQLANLLNALEDAKHTNRNIYVMYVDFSSAFNTVDHDKLLQLMWDMGFPMHAVQVVRKLYSGATTTISTSFGDSDPVSIDRGTLQGDTLSPFLFLLFIEPLLRWLHKGGNGYQHGCLPPRDRARNACSAPAYADDLAVVTNSSKAMEEQADKLTKYLRWAGMAVNHKKCGATGMLYGSASQGLLAGPLHPTTVQALQRQLSGVQISGSTVPFLHPSKEPYKYLGVLLTPSLNWTHQMSELTVASIERADGILRSMASCKQKLRLVDTLLKPFMEYSFSTGAYTINDIARLDSLVAQVAKHAFHISPSSPTAMVQEDRDQAGMGVTSLQKHYTAALAAQLTDALNDKGRLGAVTYALLKLQLEGAGCINDSQLADHMRSSRWLRAVTLLGQCGGHLLHHEGGGRAEWMQLNGCQLTKLMARLRHDPSELGTHLPLPSKYLLPLLELGITGVAQLAEAKGTHVVAATKLQEHLRRHNITGKVRSRHRVALNRLTACLNTPVGAAPPRSHSCGGCRPAAAANPGDTPVLRHRDGAGTCCRPLPR